MRSIRRFLLPLLLAFAATSATSQTRKLEISGVPALNFDADEGFGYGVILAVTRYGDPSLPYAFNLQPTLFFTTGGRRDATVSFDAPGVLAGDWRASGFIGRQQQLASPYYGIGNNTPYDASLEQGSTRYFYRYGHERYRAAVDFQHRLGATPLRVLIGGAEMRDRVDLTPFDSGRTLIENQLGGRTPAPDNRASLRGGLIWDSRDREIGTRSGTWASVLAEGTTPASQAAGFQRITGTYRAYIPLSNRLVFAERDIGQRLYGSTPFYDLAQIQTEFQPIDGLGGSSSIRGLPKDRYVGRALVLSNSELRWHAFDFTRHGRESWLVLNAFMDAGRVWSDDISAAAPEHGLHAGVGGGARLGFGKSFVVGVDVAHAPESSLPIYIGLGYLF